MVESYRRRVRKDRETGLAALTLAVGGFCVAAMIAGAPVARTPQAASTGGAQRLALVEGVTRIAAR